MSGAERNYEFVGFNPRPAPIFKSHGAQPEASVQHRGHYAEGRAGRIVTSLDMDAARDDNPTCPEAF